jgi:cysteinyl-tRNA synthetase
LKSAAIAIERLRNFKLRLETDRFPEGCNQQLRTRTSQASEAFTSGLNDDLNTAEALAAVFEFVRDANSAMDAGEFHSANGLAALEFIARFDDIFQVLTPSGKAGSLSDGEVEARVAERTAAKKARDFALSDRIRDELLEQGIVIEDTKAGVRWKRK